MSTRVLSKMRIGVLAVITVALLLAGCGGSGSTGAGGQPSRGGTLNVAQSGEVVSLNPYEGIDFISVHVFSEIVEPLMKANPDGKVEPWLAEKVTKSADGKTWTIALRQGVTFSDGKPMTAADVVFSLEKVRHSINWAAMFEAIASIKASSPETVVIKLKEPVAAMEAQLSLFAAAIVPKDFGGVSEKQFAEHPIGTGPFVLASWKHGQSISFDRNPHYWQQGKPYLDHLVFKTVPDDSSRISQLQAGQVDLIEGPPWAQLDALESEPGTSVDQTASGFSSFLELNLHSKPFTDPRIREAVNLALDRPGINKAALAGAGRLGGSWLASGVLYSNQNLKPAERDTAQAQQLVAEAVADGVEPKFTLTIGTGDSFASSASQIIQQNLEEVGFTVDIKSLDGAAQLESWATEKYSGLLFGVGTDIPDPSELMSYYVAGDALYSGGKTEEIGKLFEESTSELDPAKRRDLYYRMQELTYEENNLIALVYPPYVWAMHDSVAGFENNALNAPLLANVGFSE